MSRSTAADVLALLGEAGIEISLTEEFHIDARPATKLLPLHREMLRCEKRRLVTHLARLTAVSQRLIPEQVALASKKYYSHHFGCPICISGGLGYGERCVNGKGLWFRYKLYGFI